MRALTETSTASAPVAAMTIREADLQGLRYDWGEAYRIGQDDRRGWWARRRDDKGGDITAGSADELRDKIRADYFARPVPRYLPAGG